MKDIRIHCYSGKAYHGVKTGFSAFGLIPNNHDAYILYYILLWNIGILKRFYLIREILIL